jgi:hypothetical protein
MENGTDRESVITSGDRRARNTQAVVVLGGSRHPGFG